MAAPSLTVVGSINLDLVVQAERLPRPGETVSGAQFSRVPGGKGANQAVAAARLGARVAMFGCVGGDARRGRGARRVARGGRRGAVASQDAPTGVALITVDAAGETTIVVAPGANAELRPEDSPRRRRRGPLPAGDSARDRRARGRAGAAVLPQRGAGPPGRAGSRPHDREPARARRARRAAGLVCLTLGAEGAVLLEDGREIARAEPPPVEAVDGTAAGDAFTACLVVSLLEGRPRDESLRRACAAGALAASRFGAQTSLPTAQRRWTHSCEHDPDRHRLRPRPRRRDRDPARARLARGRADRRHDRRRQPDARQDDPQRARHARGRRPRRHPGRRRRGGAVAARAPHGRARARRDRPRRAGAARAVRASRSTRTQPTSSRS